VPREAAVVYKIFELYFSGKYGDKRNYSAQGIADKLNDLGYRSRNGSCFTSGLIRSVVSHLDRYNSSIYKYRSFTIPHDPILNEDGTPYRRFPEFEHNDSENNYKSEDPNIAKKRTHKTIQLILKYESGAKIKYRCLKKDSMRLLKVLVSDLDCSLAFRKPQDNKISEIVFHDDGSFEVKDQFLIKIRDFAKTDPTGESTDEYSPLTVMDLIAFGKSAMGCDLVFVTHGSNKIISIKCVN
jgi:hypothetical protein